MLQCDCSLIGVRRTDPALPITGDDCETDGCSQNTHAGKDCTSTPPPPNVDGLPSIRKEEVEEETSTKYRCHVDASEDIEGGNAYIVVVVYFCCGVQPLDFRLLVDVVWFSELA